MRISPLILIFTVYFSFIHFAFAADSIPVEPGQWQMTTTMTSPMSPQPRVSTATQCMDKDEFSISDLMPKDESECTITEANVSGNTLTWTMQCEMQGGSGTGGGQFTSNGDSGSGEMHMNMQFQGQTFNMTNSWEGHRIGPC